MEKDGGKEEGEDDLRERGSESDSEGALRVTCMWDPIVSHCGAESELE